MKPWMATPRKHYVAREIAECVLFLAVLFAVVAAMSLEYVA